MTARKPEDRLFPLDHWRPHDLQDLMKYRKHGVKFAEIARLTGRTQQACEDRYNYEMKLRRKARLKGLVHKRDLPIPPLNAPKPSVVTESSTSAPTIGHSTLLANGADTRDIAERGASAVMFGDPPPGRSALDQRNKELTDEKTRGHDQGGGRGGRSRYFECIMASGRTKADAADDGGVN